MIDKDEGILKDLDLDEEDVNKMIMKARENWFEEKILTAIFVFLSTMALGFTVVYIVYISAKLSGLIDKMKKLKDPRKTI